MKNELLKLIPKYQGQNLVCLLYLSPFNMWCSSWNLTCASVLLFGARLKQSQAHKEAKWQGMALGYTLRMPPGGAGDASQAQREEQVRAQLIHPPWAPAKPGSGQNMGFKSLGNWLKVCLRSSTALNFPPSSSAPTPAGGSRFLSQRNRPEAADLAHEHGWRVGVRGGARKRGEGSLHTKWETPVSPAPNLCSDQRALLQRN